MVDCNAAYESDPETLGQAGWPRTEILILKVAGLQCKIKDNVGMCIYTLHTHNSSIHILIISNCIIHICGFTIFKCVKIPSSTTDKKEVGGSVSDEA